ncbi:hypothetical protein EMPS_01801 [Entomortierella parvispora]|uniref:Uncharacterized protein n=1 Tax=Entomortierella parvispora TaxID=205924 RepID=A0A9P3H3R4_9FUNG|nr:hypothetical protein EMPS_01801 [Entomortierella parvispora]
MGNSPSSPSGQADGSSSTSSADRNSNNNSSTSVNKQDPVRGKHSNIPIQPPPRPQTTTYVPVTQHRPPLPPGPAQPRPPTQQQQQQQQQLQPFPHIQPRPHPPANNTAPVPLPQRQQQPNPSLQRMTGPSSQTQTSVTEDEIPTVVLKEQMESMSIEIATAEHRVRELREELDTFESHTDFSTMMLAWFYSFNPGDYTMNRLEDLKRDALKAWQPVLSSFKEANPSTGSGQSLTEIDVELFESIIQDVISHANLIVGSTLPPEQLIENIKQVARAELQNARKRLDDNRNAFQECQITLQQRGVVPASVLAMQRQIEEEQRQELEARRAKEQRQKDLEAQKQREILNRQREEREKREREHEEEEERKRQELEEILRKQEEMRLKIEEEAAKRARPSASAGHTVAGRQKSSSVAVPNSLPTYVPQFPKHAEAPAALGMTFTEEETVLTDYNHPGRLNPTFAHQHSNSSNSIPGAYPPSNHSRADPEWDEEEVPSTPLIRRQRPFSNAPDTSAPKPGTTPEQKQGAGMVTGMPAQYGFRIPVPGEGPYPPERPLPYPSHASPYPPTSATTAQIPTRMPVPYGFNANHHQAQELPQAMPEVPSLYPPQIITEHDLEERKNREKLELLKKQNEEMERGLYESRRVHDLTVQNMELQGVYPPYSHPTGLGGEPNQEEYHSYHNQHVAPSPYVQFAGYPPPQHLQQGYQGYHGEYQTSAQTYNMTPYSGAQDPNYQQGDMHNFAPYGQYNQTGPWSPQPLQNQGYVQPPNQQQSVYPPPPGQQQQQPMHQQTHYHQQQHQTSSPGHEHQHALALAPGQQQGGYVDPRVPPAQNTVVYSNSPYGEEYDLGSPSAGTAPVENEASSAQVLPQIRANPPKPPPFRRAPQAILVEESSQEEVTNDLKAMDLKDSENQVQSQNNDLVSVESVPADSEDCTQQKPSEPELSQRPSSHSSEESSTGRQQRRVMDDEELHEEEEEEEEEVLQRSSRVVRAAPRPSPRPSPRPISMIEPTSPPASTFNNSTDSMHLSATPVAPLRLNNRTSQVFNPFPNQRTPPRPSPRPAPRAIGGMSKASHESLPEQTTEQDRQSDHGSFNSRSSDGKNTPPQTTTESTTPRPLDVKRLSVLSRSPSVPPAVPKKPVGLRSPRGAGPSLDHTES